MFLHKWAITMAVSTAAALAAAPTINGIGNAASNRLFSSPIAQGGIFIIQGSGLGPANVSMFLGAASVHHLEQYLGVHHLPLGNRHDNSQRADVLHLGDSDRRAAALEHAHRHGSVHRDL